MYGYFFDLLMERRNIMKYIKGKIIFVIFFGVCLVVLIGLNNEILNCLIYLKIINRYINGMRFLYLSVVII